MPKPDVAAITMKIHALIKDLDSEMRARAISAALTLVGDKAAVVGTTTKSKEDNTDDNSASERAASTIHPKVRIWMKSHGVTQSQLDEVFHTEGDEVSIIASDLPGANGAKKTIEAYVLVGIAKFLQSGEAKFDDKSGRDACNKFGCYQGTNHATILKNKGNELTGSKKGGWSLTGPGLKFGAAVIKSIASPETN